MNSGEFDVETIQSNFGLTIAEAKLVKALVNGCHNLNDVAEKLNLSIHTVRTQIKHTFEKNRHQQSDGTGEKGANQSIGDLWQKPVSP